MKNIYKKEDFFQILGNISRVFATLDFFMTMLICRLLDAKEIKRNKIKSTTTLGGKTRIMKKLKSADVNYPKVLKKIQKIIPEIEKINKKRNRYEHDQWVFSKSIESGKIKRIEIKIKDQLNANVFDIKETTLDISSLKKIIKEVILIQEKVRKISESMPHFDRNKLSILK